ncbi:hypothetical protein FX983_06542 [Pseudomonas frederiksbergensis]|uniref:Uncharacterized protein n=1 Tax=Pseudomonas frederiksbergensis TaxID=104087 RepID=A0A6L5BMV7_9PSED|nr:hypothetical protein FX983_06542 [Pseudomonas frederiksbergensis]
MQVAAECVDVQRCLCGVIGDQAFFARHVFAGQDGGFVDVGVLGKFGFDFAQFDAEATDFDLIVVAAEVFDVAVFQVTAEVAGTIHAGVGAEWIDEEAFGG